MFAQTSSETARRMLHASCNKRSIFHRALKGPFSREVARFSLSPPLPRPSRGTRGKRAPSCDQFPLFSSPVSQFSVCRIRRAGCCGCVSAPAVEYIHVEVKNVCQCAPRASMPKPLSINRIRGNPLLAINRGRLDSRRFTCHQNLSSSLH